MVTRCAGTIRTPELNRGNVWTERNGGSYPLLERHRAELATRLPEVEHYTPPDVDMIGKTNANTPSSIHGLDLHDFPTVNLVQRKRLYVPSHTQLPQAKKQATDENRSGGVTQAVPEAEWWERFNGLATEEWLRPYGRSHRMVHMRTPVAR